MNTKIKKIVLGFMSTLGLLGAPLVTYAATTSANTTINANIASVISMTTSGTVNMNVTPTTSGSMSTAADSVSVSTNNALGFVLTFSAADTNTNLVNGANTIAAHTGTQATPTTMAVNRWGYRVDGAGGFGAGPTSAETNVASGGSYIWAGVPSSAAPNTIKTTSTTATNNITTVWYGVRADSTKPNGTYADVVTYTATTN